MSMRHAIVRRAALATSFAAPTRPRGRGRGERSADGSTLTLERTPDAFVDRVLPAHGGPFLAAVAAIAAAVWAAGGALAADRARWLASREWQVQPLYLAVHLTLVRAFASSYASNFLAGCSHLRMDAEDARRRVRHALGWRSLLVAAVLATPLVALDVAWATDAARTAEHAGLGAGGGFGVADGFMVGVWALEWVLNAYVWVLVVAFLGHTMRSLGRHEFREPVETVLRERHYRPFLLMTAQGASLTALFAIASVGYVALTRGAASDYAGLWATGALVLVGFVPPWARLKSSIGAVVATETRRLDGDIAAAQGALDRDRAEAPASLAEIGREVRVVRSILRAEHLQRLHAELGKSEAQAVVLRLVAPAMTLVWRVFKPF